MKDWADERLMESYKCGSPEAFNELFERYRSKVYGFVRARVGDASANDVTQEVFFKLHRSRSRYTNSLPFVPWFFTLCRHVIFDHLRKEQKLPHKERSMQEYYQERLSAMNQEVAEPEELHLKELSSREEAVLSLHYFNDFSFSQVATTLGITASNARKIASRAIDKLRRYAKGSL